MCAFGCGIIYIDLRRRTLIRLPQKTINIGVCVCVCVVGVKKLKKEGKGGGVGIVNTILETRRFVMGITPICDASYRFLKIRGIVKSFTHRLLIIVASLKKKEARKVFRSKNINASTAARSTRQTPLATPSALWRSTLPPPRRSLFRRSASPQPF